jgi:uncharacterized protein with ParB-like and HNH nuclease domain
MTETKLLYSIKEIFDTKEFLSHREVEFFNIPHYQRGYKWEPSNVEKLLNDIYTSRLKDDLFYCVQNITITKKDNFYNVIDGQQRLTTLTIILSFLGEKELVYNKVRFPENSIRKFTNKTLNEWVTNQDFDFYSQFTSWSDVVLKHPDYDLQDIYHIVQVALAVKKWFEKLKEKEGESYVESFKTKFLYNVKLIVNEVEGSQSEEKIFGNLNSKRIPLDGSDLIRAILITRVAKEEAKDEGDLKNIIFVNERRIKLGWELDQINAWWSKDEVKTYFKRLVKIKSENIGKNKLFNEDFYPINNLYLLFAESNKQNVLSLELIENTLEAIALYKDIIHLHHTLYDWFHDREIYHLLGYIFSNQPTTKKSIDFYKVWELWKKSSTRNVFVKKLKEHIKTFFREEDKIVDFTNLQINWYDDKTDLLIKTLMLMDIIECLKENKAFLPPVYFKKNLEDIEHIFPKNPKDKSNSEIVKYVKLLIKIGELEENNLELSKLESKLDDEDYKIKFLDFLAEKTSSIKENSIGNLVLLHRSLNRGLGNKVYEQKRSKIISFHNEGNFIQPHTFKVFVRDFLNDSQKDNYTDNEFWLQNDIVNNTSYINQQINHFFT